MLNEKENCLNKIFLTIIVNDLNIEIAFLHI